ncbi:MAG: TIGR03619 family F420-dependent LLM class oxidoreductase [Chloroflexi bacterium]|nr:MAG: TIGR03619 family F420-dependent LLM class oxidoreductase [Chloroflexota bacterium]
MRVGLDLPVLTATSREAVLAYARAAESLGFDSLWSNSHTVVPVTFAPRYPYSADGRPVWNATSSWPDAMTTMAFVAAATERVRLGIAVVPLITTHPIRLAKQVATIDVLSKGRFELGVGGGWLVEEAQALGNPTDHPVARMEETIEILRLAWREPTFSYDGRFWKIPPVGVNPRPLQGERLPLWIGGHGDAAVRVGRWVVHLGADGGEARGIPGEAPRSERDRAARGVASARACRGPVARSRARDARCGRGSARRRSTLG